MIVDIIFCVIGLIILILGAKKGLVGLLLGVIVSLGIFVGSYFLTPVISNALVDTSIGGMVIEKIDNRLDGDGALTTLLKAPITAQEDGEDSEGNVVYAYYVEIEGETFTIEDAVGESFSSISKIPVAGPAILSTMTKYAVQMAESSYEAQAEGESSSQVSLIYSVERVIAVALLNVIVYILLIIIFMIIRKIIKHFVFKAVEKAKVLNTVDHIIGFVVGLVIVLALGFGLVMVTDYVSYKDYAFSDVLEEQVLGGVVLPVLHQISPLNDMVGIPKCEIGDEDEQTDNEEESMETRTKGYFCIIS